MILTPQLIHHELHNPVMGTTANVVAHMDIKQGERPIRLGVIGEASLVGVGVDLLLDGFGLWGLSHLLLSFLCYHSTLIIVTCQAPSRENFPYNFVRFEIANAVPIVVSHCYYCTYVESGRPNSL